MSQLYRQLKLVSQSLHSVLPAEQDGGKSSANQQIPTAVYTRLAAQSASACNMLEETTPDLLDLSVLVPSAPWVSPL